jgi:predicted ATP-grasp superfamily ATP-dependent carboligase
MHKEIRSIPITGGSGSYLESIYDSALKNNSIKLLDSLGWHGVALIEFKKNRSGNYYLMEINGKLWASIEVALKAGCNFPFYLCLMANQQILEYSEEYVKNLKFQVINREIAYCRNNFKAIPQIILDTLNPRVKSNFWFSDFKATLFDMLNN